MENREVKDEEIQKSKLEFIKEINALTIEDFEEILDKKNLKIEMVDDAKLNLIYFKLLDGDKVVQYSSNPIKKYTPSNKDLRVCIIKHLGNSVWMDESRLPIYKYNTEVNNAEYLKLLDKYNIRKEEEKLHNANNSFNDILIDEIKDGLKYFLIKNRCSASLLKMFFGIGFPKAYKMMNIMEEMDYVSKPDANGKRELLIDETKFKLLFGEDVYD